VTIGGIVTQARKIRTRAGADMMFATLDDLEAQVEIIVFGSALEKLEGTLAVDSIVTVRGRVDQKEEGRTSVVAQSVEEFRPDAEQLARAHAAVLEAAHAKRCTCGSATAADSPPCSTTSRACSSPFPAARRS